MGFFSRVNYDNALLMMDYEGECNMLIENQLSVTVARDSLNNMTMNHLVRFSHIPWLMSHTRKFFSVVNVRRSSFHIPARVSPGLVQTVLAGRVTPGSGRQVVRR